MIELKDLKVGRLYKVRNKANDVTCYRVWLGNAWSMGTPGRCKKEHIYYTKEWNPFDLALPLHLSTFASANSDNHYNSVFTPPIPKVQKQYRYLNRPSEQV
jgi:hypothetical protein